MLQRLEASAFSAALGDQTRPQRAGRPLEPGLPKAAGVVQSLGIVAGQGAPRGAPPARGRPPSRRGRRGANAAPHAAADLDAEVSGRRVGDGGNRCRVRGQAHSVQIHRPRRGGWRAFAAHYRWAPLFLADYAAVLEGQGTKARYDVPLRAAPRRDYVRVW